jgi:glycosyltransferase involved in cell wall biosynthesis
MKLSPLVSVITPTYNRAKILPTAIKSVQNQTYKKWEMIIIDDGSTDNTRRVVESFKDARLRYFQQANGGPTKARNFGLSKAKGKWIMYLDSDDTLLPECITTMVEWLENHPGKVFGIPRAKRVKELYQDGQIIKTLDDSSDTPEHFTLHDIFMRNAGFACNGFTHLRNIYSKGIKWDENLRSMEDWELLMSIGEKYPNGFLYVPIVLYEYHQRYGSDNMVSKATYSTWADAFDYIYQKHKGHKHMKGQTWYPAKADKWRRLQAEYEAGARPEYKFHYFQ